MNDSRPMIEHARSKGELQQSLIVYCPYDQEPLVVILPKSVTQSLGNGTSQEISKTFTTCPKCNQEGRNHLMQVIVGVSLAPFPHNPEEANGRCMK